MYTIYSFKRSGRYHKAAYYALRPHVYPQCPQQQPLPVAGARIINQLFFFLNLFFF